MNTLWSSSWRMRTKTPESFFKFPLLFFEFSVIIKAGTEMCLPLAMYKSPFYPDIDYRGCRISMWFAGLPAAVCGRTLEAIKQAGDNPPAQTAQVIIRLLHIAIFLSETCRILLLRIDGNSCIICRYDFYYEVFHLLF